MRSLLPLLLLLSCKDPLDHPETHKHAPIFAGVVRSTAEHNHIELYVHRSGLIEVYLYDQFLNPLPSAGATGSFTLTFEDGHVETFPLSYGAPDHHDMLQGQINKPFPTKFIALVEATIPNALVDPQFQKTSATKKMSFKAKFEYDLNKQRDKVAHMHDARQGGQVSMIGEQHVELVSPSPGEYRIYLSDMARGPLPPSLAKQPSLVVDPDGAAPEVLPLVIDPTQTFLQATGEKNNKDPLPVQVRLTLEDKPGSIDFQWMRKPK